MKVTHILYLTEIAGRSPLSGAENHLWQLLPALVRHGCDVELLAVLWWGQDFLTVRRKLDELRNKGVTVTEIIRNCSHRTHTGEALSKIETWWKVLRGLRARRNRIIHMHLELKYTPYLAMLARCRRLLYSIHNDLPMFQEPAWRFRLRTLNHLMTHYIAITEHVRTYFLEVSGAKPEKVTTILYGINRPTAPPYTRQDFGIPMGIFTVGFVGRLTRQKNLFVFLDALQRRPECLGLIVGSGIQRDDLLKHVRINQITNVRFLGPVDDAYRIMPLFDVFCLPSLWEGLGLVLIEAMLNQVPIIASARGAIPEILGQGEYGILCEPTVDALIESIDEAMDSRKRLRDRAETACIYAKTAFGVDRMTQQTLTVYNRILKRE